MNLMSDRTNKLNAMIVTGIVGMSIFGIRAFYRFYSELRKISLITKKPALTYYHKGGFEANMSTSEAKLILDLSNSSSESKILENHRRIMLRNHPDRGGSLYLATKINEAKNVLLKQ